MRKKQSSDRLGEQLREVTWQPVSEDTRRTQMAAIDSAVQNAPSVASSVSRRRRLHTIALAAAVLVVPAGMAVAAEASLPGDVLYPIKKVTESVRSWVDADVVAEHRVEELEKLIELEASAAEIESQLDAALAEVDQLDLDHQLRPRLNHVATELPTVITNNVVRPDDGRIVAAAPSESESDRPSDTTSTSTPTTTIDDPTTTTSPGTTLPSEVVVTKVPTTTITDTTTGDTTVIQPEPTIVPSPTSTVPIPESTVPSTTTTTTTTKPPEVERHRVVGYVHAGPVCPVERFPPDPDCADRPVQGAVLIVTTEDGKEVGRAESNARGNFAFQLPDGGYVLSPQPVEGLLGTAPQQRFFIDGAPIQLDVAYDTGIR